jgi:hypothetical protein
MFAHLNGRSGTMNKNWFCVSCLSQISLDVHGRCSTCGSDAVERISVGAYEKIQQELILDCTPTPTRPAIPVR